MTVQLMLRAEGQGLLRTEPTNCTCTFHWPSPPRTPCSLRPCDFLLSSLDPPTQPQLLLSSCTRDAPVVLPPGLQEGRLPPTQTLRLPALRIPLDRPPRPHPPSHPSRPPSRIPPLVPPTSHPRRRILLHTLDDLPSISLQTHQGPVQPPTLVP